MARKKKMEIVEPESELGLMAPFSDRFMRRFFSMPMPGWGQVSFGRLPRVDMEDEGKTIRIKADLPGVEKNDVKLNVERNSITISARAHREEERTERNYYYRERSAAGYYRSIALPAEVDASSAKARFANGTLEVTVNKKNPSGSAVKIE